MVVETESFELVVPEEGDRRDGDSFISGDCGSGEPGGLPPDHDIRRAVEVAVLQAEVVLPVPLHVACAVRAPYDAVCVCRRVVNVFHPSGQEAAAEHPAIDMDV